MTDRTLDSDTGDAAAHAAKLQQDIDRLKVELAKLRGDVTDVMGAARELGTSGAATIKDKVAMGVEEAKKVLAAAKEKGDMVVETAQDTIKERPLTSVLIAFGVGVLVAKVLLSRR